MPMPLNDRLQAVRWACGSVLCLTVLAFLAFVIAFALDMEMFRAIGWSLFASLIFLHLTLFLSVRLLVRWRDPSPEDRKKLRLWKYWGGIGQTILTVWILTDEKATSPFFKDWNR